MGKQDRYSKPIAGAAMKVLSVEDEPIVAERIERLCRNILGDRLKEFKSVDHLGAALSEAENGVYDLILLDLNLSGEDGFKLLQSSTSYSSHTIIISANKDRAIEAYDHGVIDFVGKPFNEERLKQAFDRFDGGIKPEQTMRYLSFRQSGRTDVRGLDAVNYIEGADKYAQVHFQNGETMLHDKSLAQLEKTLPPEFERIHKSYIVRFSAISSLIAKEGSRYSAQLANGETLPISRSRYKSLKSRLG